MKEILPVFHDLLCHPLTKVPLAMANGSLLSPDGTRFAVIDGIPDLRPPVRPLRHSIWEWVYNLSAFGYDFGARFTWRFGFGGAPLRRESYADLVQVPHGALVLETAAGTGENILPIAQEARCIAVDQSRAMLRRFQRKLERTGKSAGLIQADMAALPLLSGRFDIVFHVGGLQFLSKPQRGLAEMLRVARRGSTITVIDESSSLNATLRRAGAGEASGLVPPGGRMVHFGRISGGELYALQFTRESEPE